jgi:hypothetical protein
MNCAVNECGGNLTVFHFGESESAVESCVESCGSFTLVNIKRQINILTIERKAIDSVKSVIRLDNLSD